MRYKVRTTRELEALASRLNLLRTNIERGQDLTVDELTKLLSEEIDRVEVILDLLEKETDDSLMTNDNLV